MFLSCVNWIFSVSYTRQEHCETQMLRKRVKDLETEYKQLQLECQVKESRVVDLESDVEVSFQNYLGMNLCLVSLECRSTRSSSVWSCSFFFCCFELSMSFLILCVCEIWIENWKTVKTFSIFILCWPAVDVLHSVMQWYCMVVFVVVLTSGVCVVVLLWYLISF